jgi:hypothetical protein
MKYAVPEETEGIGILFSGDEMNRPPSPDPTAAVEAEVLAAFSSALFEITGGKEGLQALLMKSCLRAIPLMLPNPVKHEKAMFGVYVERFLRETTNWPRGEIVRERKGKKHRVSIDFQLPFNAGDPRAFAFDLRCASGGSWTIPPGAVGEICLLVNLSQVGTRRYLSCGAFVADPDSLLSGTAVGGRAGIKKDARKRIKWLIGGKTGALLPKIYEGRELIDLGTELIEMQVDGKMTRDDAITAGGNAVSTALKPPPPPPKPPPEEPPPIDWGA